MDIDISDILAEAGRPSLHSHSQYAPSGHQPYDADSAHTDHQLLTRAWTSERCTPDLLPYPTELMQRVMERVRSQISRIEDLTSGMTDGLSNGYGGQNPSNQNLNLILSILQTDLSRTQFVIRSLLRARLAKVTKFATYYLKLLDESDTKDDGGCGLLSEAEASFLRHHQALLQNFYDASFLASFPRSLRRLDDSSGGVGMVEGPDADMAVVCRCLGDAWTNEDELGGDGEGGATVEVRMQKGDIMIVRWRDVKGGVVMGDVELL